jgi:formylglycine-generating enzyme required for sulfatase activity
MKHVLISTFILLGAWFGGRAVAQRESLSTVRSTTLTHPANPNPTNLVWIAPGTFLMGSPDTEEDRDSNEGPQTRVTLRRGFWMAKYPVTQAVYHSAIGENPACFNGDEQRPVESVSWTEATNYCAKLTDQERRAGRLPAGYAYRLPTEAEWEYACRAGTTTRFSYGDDPGYSQLGKYAWHGANSDGTTHIVGQKLANPWGLYDMHGNVWQWCGDWYGAHPGGSVTDPWGPTTGSVRVVRGGSWSFAARACRAASRYGPWPGAWGCLIGFRPVLAPTEP